MNPTIPMPGPSTPPNGPGMARPLLALACLLVALSAPLATSPTVHTPQAPSAAQRTAQATPRATPSAASRSHIRPALPAPTTRINVRRHTERVTRTGPPPTQNVVTAIIRKAALDAGIKVAGLLALTWCESRWHPDSYRPGNGASGLGQHLKRYWPARARAWLGNAKASVFDAWANATVTARMIRAGGLGPWERKCAQAFRDAR